MELEVINLFTYNYFSLQYLPLFLSTYFKIGLPMLIVWTRQFW